jgi:hypothetical protein
MSRFDFVDRHLQSPIQVQETLSAFLRYERKLVLGLGERDNRWASSVTSALTKSRGFIAAFPRRVFGNADHSAADPKSDQVLRGEL